MSYSITRTTPEPQPRRIDYERMQREFPKQKRALAAAVRTGDAVKVADACIAAVKVWDEIGAWPDDWAHWQRALGDVLPWNQQQDFDDVVYGRVVIAKADN